MSRLELSFLGSLQVKLDGQPVTGFEGDKVRALLVYLGVESSHPHRREQLASLFWPGWPDASARTSLRNALSNLRRAIGDETAEPPFLHITRETLQFNPEADYRLDVAEIERLARDSHASLEQLESGVALYRSAFLEGFTLKDCPAFDDWERIIRERAQQQVSALLSRLAEKYDQNKEYEKAIRCVRKRLELEPWQEEAHRQLMRLLAASGQRPAALAQFEACKRALKSELGVEPSAETLRLYESIRDSQPSEAATAKTLPRNLPVQLTRFIGRQRAIEHVKVLMEKHRLVTILGPGGVGKTRLAIQVTDEVAGQYHQGAFFIDLAVIREPGMLVPAIVKSLELAAEKSNSSEDVLLGFLRNRQVLLVLDNCEHIITACADLVDCLLRQCPGLSLLTTSREVLAVEGETVFQLQPLIIPEGLDTHYLDRLLANEAVQFFLDRARAVMPGFSLTERNASSVIAICKQLDGIPLAIELAVARLRVLSVEQIALMLAERFRLLTAGPRGVMPRQQTLQASIEWSYDLLSQEEKVLFRRLSVFAGGCTLEGIQQVCTSDEIDVFNGLDLVDKLVSKSLVLVDVEETPRYRMLETIREYAHLKLVEANELTDYRDRHLDYIAQIAAEYKQKVRTPESAAYHLKLYPEIANLRLAIGWALGREEYDRAAKGISIVYALERFGHNYGMIGEMLDWCLRGLEILPKNEPQWLEARAIGSYIVCSCFVLGIRRAEPRLIEYFLQESQQTAEQLGNLVLMANAKLCQAGYLYNFKGSENHLEACAAVKESIDIIRKTNNRMHLTTILIFGFPILNDIQGEAVAKPYLDEAYTIALETGDFDGRIMSLGAYQNLAFAKGDYETASKYNLEILTLHQEDRSQFRIAQRLTQQGLIEYYLHDFSKMEVCFQESFENYRKYAHPLRPINIEIFLLRMLGLAQLRQGKFQSARDMLLKSLDVSPNEEYYNIPVTLIFLSGVCLETDQPEQAVLLLGFAEKQLENAPYPFDDWDKVEYERIMAQARGAMDIKSFEVAWARGRAMTLEQAIAYAKGVIHA